MELRSGPCVEITTDALYVPPAAFDFYSKSGIISIFKWQADCLTQPGVLYGERNLVYSAPTSAGKTLVSEVVVTKHVLESSTKVLIILPFVSVSREKVVYLQKLFSGLGIRVGGFMGGQSPAGGLSSVSVAVCTIEKANSMINRLTEEGRLGELGLVIVDELHLIGDPHRGYLLELLLTKLVVHTRRMQSCSDTPSQSATSSQSSMRRVKGVQIIGMSATLPNLNLLGDWLDAATYSTDYRPVPLTEFVFSRDPRSANCQILTVVRSTNPSEHNLRHGVDQQHTEQLCPSHSPITETELTGEVDLNTADEDGVFTLCLDTLISGHGVLVFCPTKQWCEQLADSLARHIFRLTQSYFAAKQQIKPQSDSEVSDVEWRLEKTESLGARLASNLNRVGLMHCVDHLRRCPANLDPCLARCLGYAVAFHHAGLTLEEREIVENGFRSGVIRVLVATSTLSSGVNLPARRVIIRTPLFHGRILDYLCYKQMAGRAGRKGVDITGESILLCKPRDLPRVRQMVASGMPIVNSCLMEMGSSAPESSLKRALLEVIANGFVETVGEARSYLSSTLMATCISSDINTNQSNGLISTSLRRRSLRLSQSNYIVSTKTVEERQTGHSISSRESPSKMGNILLNCLKRLCDHQLVVFDSTPCAHQQCPSCLQENGVVRSPSNLHLFDCARIQPTALGRAVLSSSLGPTHGLVVFEELDKARRSIALDTELHLVYLLTPVYLDVGSGLDWFRYLEQYQTLSSAERRVADLIGVEESFITRCAAGASTNTHRGSPTGHRVALHRRFYTSLALYRLVCEDGLSVVAEKFGVNRGVLQSLQQQSSTYAGMVTIFCNRLGWTHMERLLTGFQSRLFYGVSEDLIDLLRLLPLVNAQRARALYSSGYTSVFSLTAAKPRDLSRILQRAVPFEISTIDEQCSRTIMLDDGSYVSDAEAAALIIVKAQELIRDDLSSVYGTNIVLVPETLGRTSEEEANPATDEQRETVTDSPFRDRKMNATSSSMSVASPSKFVSPDVSGQLQATASRKRKFDNFDQPSTEHKILKTEAYHETNEEDIINQATNLTPYSKITPSQCAGKDDDSSFMHSQQLDVSPIVSTSASQFVSDSFVLTTQLAALVDNRQNSPSSTNTVHLSSCESTRVPILTGRSPLSSLDFEMNDTLTFSMLNTALESTPLLKTHDNSSAIRNTSTTYDLFSPVVGEHSPLPVDSIEISQPKLERRDSSYPICALSDSLEDTLFSIIDVTANSDLWNCFLAEITSWVSDLDSSNRSIVLHPCWHTSVSVVREPNISITWSSGPSGSHSVGGGVGTKTNKHPLYLVLDGLAVCSNSLHPGSVFWIDINVEIDSRIAQLHDLLENLSSSRLTFIVWDAKWWLRLCNEAFRLKSSPSIFDPALAGWLRDPDQGRPSLVSEVVRLDPSLGPILEHFKADELYWEPLHQFSDWSQSVLSVDSALLDPTRCPPIPKLSANKLSDLADHISLSCLHSHLLCRWTDTRFFSPVEIPDIFVLYELPCQKLVARLESTGFVLDMAILRDCYDTLCYHAELLKKLAYRLAGQEFLLDSPREIAKVLFVTLRLPRLTDSIDQLAARKRTQVALLTGRSRQQTQHFPRVTNDLLTRLSDLHPLPSILIEWRRLHGLLEKTFTSLVSACEIHSKSMSERNHPNTECRISPTYDTFTATGRIVSCLPNIQAVPNDIHIDYSHIINRQASDVVGKAARTWPDVIRRVLAELPVDVITVRPRRAFQCSPGGILISADYCQLELRLLAHFSRDENLLRLLAIPTSTTDSDGATALPPSPEHDAFRKLAAHWLHLSSTSVVTSEQRQQAKQLCYAILYGMSAHGLSTQLKCKEHEAQDMIDSFLRAYSGVKQFIADTVHSAHEHGFVTTLKGHVRLLPVCKNSDDQAEIVSRSAQIRKRYAVAKADRQSVNTIIQGSASEVAKSAMLAVDRLIQSSSAPSSSNCQLILNEHDELVFEVVPSGDAHRWGGLIRRTMSQIAQLSQLTVPLPVKLRAGPNWSELDEVDWI